MGRIVAIIAAAALVFSLSTAFAGQKEKDKTPLGLENKVKDNNKDGDKVKDNNKDGDKVNIHKPVNNDEVPGTPVQSVPDGGSSALLLGAALLGLAGAPLLRKKI